MVILSTSLRPYCMSNFPTVPADFKQGGVWTISQARYSQNNFIQSHTNYKARNHGFISALSFWIMRAVIPIMVPAFDALPVTNKPK